MERRDHPYYRIGTLLLSVMLLGLLWPAVVIDRQTAAWNHPDLLASRDSAYGRITVTGLFGQVAVYENDTLSFETEGTGRPRRLSTRSPSSIPDPARCCFWEEPWKG